MVCRRCLLLLAVAGLAPKTFPRCPLKLLIELCFQWKIVSLEWIRSRYFEKNNNINNVVLLLLLYQHQATGKVLTAFSMYHLRLFADPKQQHSMGDICLSVSDFLVSSQHLILLNINHRVCCLLLSRVFGFLLEIRIVSFCHCQFPFDSLLISNIWVTKFFNNIISVFSKP